jgi:FkbM family methyltransferase
MLAPLRDLHPLYRLQRSSWCRRALLMVGRLLDIPVFITIEGWRYPICVRLWQNLSIVFGRGDTLEPAERAVFRSAITKTGARILWDVGANIGSYCLEFLSTVGDGEVIAIEADPANVAVLRRTVERANLPVAIVEAAASDRVDRVPFFFDELTGATGSIVRVNGATFNERHYGLTSRTAEVEAITLDSLLDHHAAPDVVKIDVEGNELAVLRGSERTLSAARPIILVEISCDRKAVVDLLLAHKYVLFNARNYAPYADDDFNVIAFPQERELTSAVPPRPPQ